MTRQSAVNRARIVILGAGPTGLGAAYRLRELGHSDFVVIDQSDRPGGLATSYVDSQGFTWDIGGHVQFSHYRYFDELMHRALGVDGWLQHQRESWVWIENRFVPYPFQNNIRYLSKETMWRCLAGLIELHRSAPRPVANFREWIVATFGPGLADVFMLPYNFKVWAHPPETMQCSWVGERVAVTDLRRVVENILLEKDDLSWGPNTTFQFPKSGGTGAIWHAVADLVGQEHLHLGQRVVAINASRKELRTAGGCVYRYETLINTLPLDAFTKILEDCPEHVRAMAGCLKYSSSNVVGIGLRGMPPERLRTKCWMYFPETSSPFYRVTVFSNYSPHNVPDMAQYWSLMAEVSESDYKPVNHATLVRDVVDGMLRTELISTGGDVVSTWVYHAHHGYPVPSLDRDAILACVLPALEQADIYSRGRFGAWKYEVSNQDHSLMQGVEVVNRLLLGTPETTLPSPETVNSPQRGKGG